MKNEVTGLSVEIQENQAVFTLDRNTIEKVIGEKTDKEWFAYANELYSDYSGGAVLIGVEFNEYEAMEELVEKYFNKYEEESIPFPEFLI